MRAALVALALAAVQAAAPPPLPAVPPAPDSAAILKSLETAGRGLKTMKASFVETKVLVLLNETQETRGDVLLQVPGRLRWNYTSPQPSAMVIKDGRFSRYIPKSKQVFRGQPGARPTSWSASGPGPPGWARSTR
jgi:outer membrane lipoprotein-sorting protein